MLFYLNTVFQMITFLSTILLIYFSLRAGFLSHKMY